MQVPHYDSHNQEEAEGTVDDGVGSRGGNVAGHFADDLSSGHSCLFKRWTHMVTRFDSTTRLVLNMDDSSHATNDSRGRAYVEKEGDVAQ